MPKERLEELAFAEYWDNRYAAAKQDQAETTLDSFEWFKNYEKLRPFFDKHMTPPPSDCHILHLGCGNSVSHDTLQFDLE